MSKPNPTDQQIAAYSMEQGPYQAGDLLHRAAPKTASRKEAVSQQWVINRIGDVARNNRAPTPTQYLRGATNNQAALSNLRGSMAARGSNLDPYTKIPHPSAAQLQDPEMARLYGAAQKRNLLSSARGAQAFTHEGMPVGGNTSYPHPDVLGMMVDAKLRMAKTPPSWLTSSPAPSDVTAVVNAPRTQVLKTAQVKEADLTGSPTGPMPTQHPGLAPKKNQSYAPIQSSKKAMDLTYLEAPVPAPRALEDTHFALGGRYPITDPHQVKVASDYLDEHVRLFAPVERREYALNLCKRASELGMPELLGETARRYGGPMTTNLEQVKHAFSSRQRHLVGEEGERHQELLDKVAAKLPYLHPHDQLQTLAAFDKVAGLERLYGTWLQDPVEALTEKWAEKAPFSEEVDGSIILENELVFLAQAGMKELKEVFGDEVVRKMRSDPVGTFKGLPKEQKILMARAAKAVHGHGHSTAVPMEEKKAFFTGRDGEAKEAATRGMKLVRAGKLKLEEILDPAAASFSGLKTLPSRKEVSQSRTSVPQISEYRRRVLNPFVAERDLVAEARRTRHQIGTSEGYNRDAAQTVANRTGKNVRFFVWQKDPHSGGLRSAPGVTYQTPSEVRIGVGTGYNISPNNRATVAHEVGEALHVAAKPQTGVAASTTPMLRHSTHAGIEPDIRSDLAVWGVPGLRRKLTNPEDIAAARAKRSVGGTPWNPVPSDSRASRGAVRALSRKVKPNGTTSDVFMNPESVPLHSNKVLSEFTAKPSASPPRSADQTSIPTPPQDTVSVPTSNQTSIPTPPQDTVSVPTSTPTPTPTPTTPSFFRKHFVPLSAGGGAALAGGAGLYYTLKEDKEGQPLPEVPVR